MERVIEVIAGTYEELTLGYRLGKDSEENTVVYAVSVKYVLFMEFAGFLL